MKTLKKILAGLFLLFGIPISIAMAVDWLNPDLEPKDRQDAFYALVIIGLPSTALGGFLAWNVYQQEHNTDRDRLRSTFFQLVEEGNGTISVMKLAMTAQISAEEARTYLNERAKEFNADFEVNDRGDITYRFPL
ncbi:MAG: hypothetical protein J7641_19080 [Cyanobacteria bacterium SID2]|nr:hypothetical protein [Cyanobacteria bacterium SID2]MBP0006667.1 hypothetical protein [Cyanobacteria bacterium SBC]